MAWPTDDLATTDTDQGTDNPSIARAMINTLLLRVKEIIGARGAVNGVCDLDAASKVPVGRLPTGTTASNVAVGNHVHTGTYEPVDATILRNANLGVSVAPLASPALTGTPTVPTAATATNNTQIASTAFTRDAIATYATSTPTSAQVAAASVGIAANIVGSYAFLSSDVIVSFGGTLAGSSLKPACIGLSWATTLSGAIYEGSVLSGTWRCLGTASNAKEASVSLWLRIA